MSTMQPLAKAQDGSYVFDAAGNILRWNSTRTAPAMAENPEMDHPVDKHGYPINKKGAPIRQPEMGMIRMGKQFHAYMQDLKRSFTTPRKKQTKFADDDSDDDDLADDEAKFDMDILDMIDDIKKKLPDAPDTEVMKLVEARLAVQLRTKIPGPTPLPGITPAPAPAPTPGTGPTVPLGMVLPAPVVVPPSLTPGLLQPNQALDYTKKSDYEIYKSGSRTLYDSTEAKFDLKAVRLNNFVERTKARAQEQGWSIFTITLATGERRNLLTNYSEISLQAIRTQVETRGMFAPLPNVTRAQQQDAQLFKCLHDSLDETSMSTMTLSDRKT